LRIYPSGQSSFSLYRDDGISFAYQRGDSTTTRFTCDARPRSVRFEIEESNKQFTPRRYELHFHLDQTPTAVALGGAPLVAAAAGGDLPAGQWTWDAARRLLAVALEDAARHRPPGRGDARWPSRFRRGPPQGWLPTSPTRTRTPPRRRDRSRTSSPPPPSRAGLRRPTTTMAARAWPFTSRARSRLQPAIAPTTSAASLGDDAGGGYALAGLATDEWTRYTVTAGNGGYFDLKRPGIRHGALPAHRRRADDRND